MISVLSAELLKLRKRPAIWLLVGVWLALNLTFAYLFPYLSYRTGEPAGPGDPGPTGALLATVLPANMVPNVLGGYPLFGGAIVLILGALMTGSEYGFGTVKTLLIQRPRRLEVLGGILGTLAVVVLGLGVASFALSASAAGLVAAAESMPGTFPPAAELARGLAAGWLILGMWGLLGALAGVAFRGTPLAIGLGLVWALVIENLIRGAAALLDVFETVLRAMPGVNAGSLVAALTPAGGGRGTPGVTAVVGGTQAAMVLACYAVGFIVLAALFLARRDVT